jgi:hypothetical protein
MSRPVRSAAAVFSFVGRACSIGLANDTEERGLRRVGHKAKALMSARAVIDRPYRLLLSLPLFQRFSYTFCGFAECVRDGFGFFRRLCGRSECQLRGLKHRHE